MFESWREGLAYLRERYPLKVFLPVAMGLTLLGFAAKGEGGPKSEFDFTRSLLAVGAMVFQFRLWDDLGDQPHDRIHHPRRVLSRASGLTRYWRTVAFAGIANVAVVALLGRGYFWFTALNGVALLWYGIVGMEWRRSLPGRHCTLLKYPAFVLSMAPASAAGLKLVLAMTAAYLGAGIYEFFHDGEIRSQPVARRLVVTETLLLAAVAVAGGYAYQEAK